MSSAKKFDLKKALALAIVCAIILVLLYGAMFSRHSSPQELCEKECERLHKTGELVYKGPATSKDFYKEAQSECKCLP